MTAVILVVEDQPAMQRNIQIGLAMSGYTVVVAADGIEALDALNSQPIDLILADVAMPRMNGYQLYEKLRQDVPLGARFPSSSSRRAAWTATCVTAKRWAPTTTWSNPFSSKICWRSWPAGCGGRANWRRQPQAWPAAALAVATGGERSPRGDRPGIPDSRRLAHQRRAASRVEK